AEESGGVINAVLLGALAGSGTLPISDAAFELAIRESAKAVDTNLAAFAFGRGHARGELEQAVRGHHKRQTAAQGSEDLIGRACAGGGRTPGAMPRSRSRSRAGSGRFAPRRR